ncbi:MAG: LysR family transcriptional regulator [Alphaproteobacteria bacterium]|nr:LysR family transcriptional regulator [Alphaproteobacteria bacterium]MDX5416774.1 LysR family transcriptional regulator [Alphaproteobacteria bacterium]MDX5494159.1 LysR family transcriptional regulator [Alphaproteobacteria bacterium]
MNLRRIDLNLLTVFDAIMAEGSVTRAAMRLGMTQPALSNALTRLRRQMDDPLFVRTVEGMQPTERAIVMAGPVRQALDIARLALAGTPDAPPGTGKRRYTIALGEIGEAVALPAAISALGADLPFGLTLQRPQDRSNLESALLEGSLDLAWTPLPMRSRDIAIEPVMKDELLCLLPPHLTGRKLTQELYFSMRHAVMRGAVYERELDRGGRRRDIVIGDCHCGALPGLVGGCGYAVVLPKRVAEPLAARHGLGTAALPFDVPDLLLHQAWPRHLDKDAQHRRLRRALKAAAR